MQLDGILVTIRGEAARERQNLVDAGAAEVTAIKAAAAEQAAEAQRAAATSLDAAADREVARIVNRARLEATRNTITEVETAYQEVLETLRVRLGAVGGTARYRDVVARLLDEGLDVLPDATTVGVDLADVELVRSVLAERERDLLVVEATRSCLGGVVLATDDGRVVKNTFDSRLDRADRRLRRLVADRIPERGSL